MKGTCALFVNVCLLVSKRHASSLLYLGRHRIDESAEVDEIEDNPNNIVLFVSSPRSHRQCGD